MSIKFKVRQGGGTASQPDLANLAAAREGVPVFASDGSPLVDMAQRWEMGQSAMGSYTYVDVDGSASYRHRPHSEVKLIEDESGTDYVIGWGRIEGGNDTARPPTGPVGHGTVEHQAIQLMDCNRDLQGLPFRTKWERPAETTWERLQALHARSLDGVDSTGTVRRKTTRITVDRFAAGHLVTAADAVDMDANTYPAGTSVLDVMEDIFTQWEGKSWGVTLHHDETGTHKCLLVLDADDVSTFTSDLKISDHIADWSPDDPDAPVLAPEWRRGAGKMSDNTEVISGLISVYGGTNDDPRSVFVETADPDDEWETWVDVYNDDKARTETQATRRANKILLDRKRPYNTPQPSITLNPEQVTLITAGQSIEVKSVVINQGADREEYVWWRIAEIRWEPLPDGRWIAHLELGRGKNAAGANGAGGHPQPGSTSPKPPPDCIPPTPGALTDFCMYNSTDDGDSDTWPGGYYPTGAGSSFDAGLPGFAPYLFMGSGQTDNLIAECGLVPGNTYHLALHCGSNSKYAYYSVYFNHNGTGPTHVQIGSTMHFPTTAKVEFDIEGDFTVPADASTAAIQFGATYGGWHYNVADITEFVDPEDAESDPDCIPEGTGGTSPYYVRSDADILTADDAHLITKLQERVTNTSGGDLAIGDIVIPDLTEEDPAVTTTTTAALTDAMVGIVTEAGADDETIVVMWQGAFTLPLNVGASTPVAGDYVFTSTTAGAADLDATRDTGAVGRVVSVNADDDTVNVLWWGVPDGAGGGGGGHDITEDGGSPFTSRANLDFRHGLDVTDDSGSDSTRIAVDESELTHNSLGGLTTGDPHTQYRLEADNHTHASSGAQGGTLDHGTALTGLTDDDHPQYMLEALASAKGELWGASANDTPAMVTASTEGQMLVGRSAETAGNKFETIYGSIQVIIDGGGSVIATGVKAYIDIPFDLELVRSRILADTSGAIKIDVWRENTFSSYPPTDSDSITGGNEPEIPASGTKDEDTTLTSWNKTCPEGSVLGINVDSVTSIQRATLSLRYKRT